MTTSLHQDKPAKTDLGLVRRNLSECGFVRHSLSEDGLVRRSFSEDGEFAFLASFLLTCLTLTGCWAVAAGAGVEGGYLVAQEDRTAGETFDDQRVTASIKSKLLADSDVSGLDINVDTFKGHVTLRGFVDSNREADTAVRLTQSVSGVQDVRSTLILKE